MRWGNITIGLVLATYAHGCASALFYRYDETSLGGWAIAMTVVCGLITMATAQLAHDQAHQERLDRNRLERLGLDREEREERARAKGTP